MKNLLALSIMLFGISSLHAQLSTPTFQDVDYVGQGDTSQFLDIYLPANINDPRPAVIYIHGGSWAAGEKGGAPRYLSDLVTEYGFVLVDINYRLSKQSTFPAQIHDCKTAIRYLRENADLYSIDTCRIGLLGSSAGAQLATLVGLSQDDPFLEGANQGYANHSSHVQAVASISGLADFLTLDSSFPNFCPPESKQDREGSAVTHLLGCQISICEDIAEDASPVSYLSTNEPPFSIHHGKLDCTVPAAQSQLLYNKLVAKDNEAEIFIYPNAGHDGLPEKQVIDRLTAFFVKELSNPIPCESPVSTGVNFIESASNWRVYPNPVSNELQLEANPTTISGIVHLRLFDTAGKVHVERQATYPSIRLYLSDLAPGIYFLEILDDRQRQMIKVIKQ